MHSPQPERADRDVQVIPSGACVGRGGWRDRRSGGPPVGRRGRVGKMGGGVSESEELPAEMWLLWGPGRSGESSPWGQVVDQSAALGIPAEELKPE